MIDKRKVCVVGTGHIGLPLAAVLAEAGFEVTGYDTNDDFVSRVNTTGAAGLPRGRAGRAPGEAPAQVPDLDLEPAGGPGRLHHHGRHPAGARDPAARAWIASGWPFSASRPRSGRIRSSSCEAPSASAPRGISCCRRSGVTPPAVRPGLLPRADHRRQGDPGDAVPAAGRRRARRRERRSGRGALPADHARRSSGSRPSKRRR